MAKRIRPPTSPRTPKILSFERVLALRWNICDIDMAGATARRSLLTRSHGFGVTSKVCTTVVKKGSRKDNLPHERSEVPPARISGPGQGPRPEAGREEAA